MTKRPKWLGGMKYLWRAMSWKNLADKWRFYIFQRNETLIVQSMNTQCVLYRNGSSDGIKIKVIQLHVVECTFDETKNKKNALPMKNSLYNTGF